MCITDALQGNTATPALPAEVKVRSEAPLTRVHLDKTKSCFKEFKDLRLYCLSASRVGLKQY